MEKYVLGFLFNYDLKDVILIRKNRPDWQKDKWNGLGGKLKENKSAEMEMSHKFEEEGGKRIDHWIQFAELIGEDYHVACFCAKDFQSESKAIMNDETVDTFEVNSLPKNVIPNVRFLIPLAIDKLKNKHSFETVHITYSSKNIKS